MITVITFLILLSILIFVHELGHFLAARRVGIKVEEFAFGLPFTKPLISKAYKGVKLSIYPILFGGFVKLFGEEGQEKPPFSRLNRDSAGKQEKQEKKEWKSAFFAKSKLERTFVILAGVAMNFLLAVLVISFIFTQGVLVPAKRVTVTKILKNSPAEKAGLKINDIILEIDGKKVTSPEELIKNTREKLGKTVVLTILRKGEVLGGSTRFILPTLTPAPTKKGAKGKIIEQKIFVRITPRKKYPAGEGPMGVGISNLEVKKFPLYQAPFLGLMESLGMSYAILREFILMVWRLLTLAKVPKEVAGPVGIAQLTNEAVKFGYIAVLQLLAMLSLNLAVINALPFPALDGGRLLFIFTEDFFGKKNLAKAEQIVNNIGMAILLTLILIITVNDLNRLLNLAKIWDKIVATISK